MKAKPFVKWAGGKGQLLKVIESNLPNNMSRLKKYIEPFVGGGAVLFFMLEKFNFEKVVINDLNKDLIQLYKTIK
ncbi:MAG: DNA adenine methylase, partial [Thermotogaceae bacterium]|nr:DNA adenine methylase [Thermotogaceae bacterium]